MCLIQLNENQSKAIKTYVHSSNDDSFALASTNISLNQSEFTFQLNGVLRANLGLGIETNNYLKILDSAFQNHTIDNDLTVYRAFNYLEMIRYINNGNYLDLGYMSTSKSTFSIQSFFETPTFGYAPAFLKIFIPAGSSVLDLNIIEGFDNNTYEDEVLLRRKSFFEILSLDEVTTVSLENQIGKEIQTDFPNIFSLSLRFLRYFPLD